MKIKLSEALQYEQPTKYIVNTEDYDDNYKIPVLTAGKSFILGYTNETKGIYDNLPVIIFDDFTTDVKFVDFPFKVKSSAMKMLQSTSQEFNLKYFYYLIKFMDYHPASHQRHWISKFAEFKIDVPSRQKQDEIVKKLDNICCLKVKKEEKIKNFDLLVKSQFIEMFGDDSNPKNWPIERLENLCKSIVRGPFGSALKKEFFVEKSNDTYKVYEQKNAIQKSSKLGEYYINKNKYNELKRFECKPGDFIMSCSGTMGELYRLPDDSEKGIINQALCKFTINDKLIPEMFLQYLCRNIGKLKTQGSGIQNIASVVYIKNLQIPLPPIELQNQFAEFVQHIDKLKFTIKQSIEKLEICYKSLMNEYFN